MLDERIEQAIVETGAKVIILDPVQAYIGAQIDMNRVNEVRNVLSQLGRVAEKHGCAVAIRSGANGCSLRKKILQPLWNANLRAENKDYKLLRKSFGSKQMNNFLEQAKAVQQSKQRGKRFRS